MSGRARTTMMSLWISAAMAAESRAQTNFGNIMPLGDSITWGDAWTWTGGLWGQGTGTENAIPGGYRQQLYSDLIAAGSSFEFVGTVTSNSTPQLTAAGDAAQEAHPGYRIADIDANLSGSNGQDTGYWLTGLGSRPAIYPNNILLMAGTNDMIAGLDPTYDVNVLLNKLLADLYTLRPGVHIYLAELIPIPAFPAADVDVREFNYLLPAQVARFTAAGDAITLVDTFDSFVNADGSDNLSLTSDGVHPTQAGYDLLGDDFAAAMLGTAPPVPQPKLPKPGDANNDGAINGDDYTLIDNGFNNHLSGWANGDFNLDGVVNGDDYTIIDNEFNSENAGGASDQAAAPTSEITVPEPAGALTALSFVAALSRRKRRRLRKNTDIVGRAFLAKFPIG